MKKLVISVLAVLLTLGLASAEAKSAKEKPLPPGLQKKVERGGELPPGWQNKLTVGESLDEEVYDSAEVIVPVDDHGILTIKVEDRIVKLIEASREIVETLE
jgi:hypothetical protein